MLMFIYICFGSILGSMVATPRTEIGRDTFFVLLIACGLFGLYVQHFGVFALLLVLTAAQSLIILPYASEHGKRRGSHIYKHGPKYELVWVGALIALLSVAQYIGFFWRHGISLEFITPGTPMFDKGAALVYLTITCCVTIYIIQQVTKESFIHKRIYREHIWRAAGLSLLCSAFLLYWPFITIFSQTNSLSIGDWLLAFLAAGSFASIREFQHWDRSHHPKNVHALHKR